MRIVKSNNSGDMETTQVFADRLMDKEDVVHIGTRMHACAHTHTRISFGHKNMRKSYRL